MSRRTPCTDYTERIGLFAGNDLGPAETADVERHLLACPPCARLAADLRADRQALGQLPEPDIDAKAMAAGRAAVLARLAAETEVARLRTRRPWWALAAVLVLTLGLAATWRMQLTDRPQARPGGQDRRAAADPETTVRPAPPRTETPQPETPPPEMPAAEAPAPERIAARQPAVAPAPPRRGPAAEPPERRVDAEPQLPSVPTVPPEPPRPASAEPVIAEASAEPLLIQLVSDDADLVIYWLVETEESYDENVHPIAD